ncbi:MULTISPECIES: DUF6341 family protein [Chryseobacterium]|jgi:hypothetical protein|uniref:Polysaccharide deacetylase n=2 Tax=Chryseobacterium TaxID=59732 RepID=A0A511YB95_9FLAO|nr:MULTISPECIES: hypothetical protein [Chryseobacterium]MDP9960086.1 hypothetical protein [Chryseobacterium lathyri]MDQ0067670.1 hypothetical protein [Chryseobacterium lathyri]REC79799.1 hypothetical protein DRF60_05195 [Chryseobacterium elymi]GEN72461.1 hypothetical protein CLA01_25330 [Chryseobacterium lathyri]
MTSFWLFLSKVFKWAFGFFDAFGNVLNWILFIVCCVLFTYWCYVLVVKLGGDKDKDYYSPTEGKNPYYDPKIYKKEG